LNKTPKQDFELTAENYQEFIDAGITSVVGTSMELEQTPLIHTTSVIKPAVDSSKLLVIENQEFPKKEGESFAEMQRRVVQNVNIRKRIEIANKNNIIQGKSYSYSEIKEIFNNDELFNNEFYKQLSNVLQSSNLVFRFGSLNQGKKTINAYYNSISNSINIDTLVLQTPNLATSDFKRILLHEIIHAATFINLSKDATLTNTQKTALSNLNSIIEELNKDRDFFGQYGLKNANELLAELANDRFVDKLKNKTFSNNQSFFNKIISEIVKLLGLSTTAYNLVKESFDNLIKEYQFNQSSKSLIDSPFLSDEALKLIQTIPMNIDLNERHKILGALRNGNMTAAQQIIEHLKNCE
jgi:hypothetical protein